MRHSCITRFLSGRSRRDCFGRFIPKWARWVEELKTSTNLASLGFFTPTLWNLIRLRRHGYLLSSLAQGFFYLTKSSGGARISPKSLQHKALKKCLT